MTDSPWNPPTGPPNGVPLRPADARREIDDAIVAARAADHELRVELSAATTARVHAADQLALAADVVEEAESLAKRALTQANEVAQTGRRDEAAKLTAAAQVFAMRMRDGREARAELERQVATATDRAEQARAALTANIGRLEAVAAARLPVLSGRKASKAQREVDEVVAMLATPTDDLVAAAVAAGHAAAEAAEEHTPVEVADDDLESEVDVESTDDILAELRTSLGLPAPPGSAAAASDSGPSREGTADDDPQSDAETAEGSGPDGGSGSAGPTAGPGASGRRGRSGGRSWPVPAARH